MKRAFVLAFLLLIAAASAPATQSNSEAELRHIIALLREEVVELRSENAALRKQLAAGPASQPAFVGVAPKPDFEDRARRIKGLYGHPLSAKDRSEMIATGRKIDAAVSKYLAKAKLSPEIQKLIASGEVKPGIPWEALKLYGGFETLTETTHDQIYYFTTSIPDRSPNTFDVTVIDGIVDRVTFAAPTQGVENP